MCNFFELIIWTIFVKKEEAKNYDSIIIITNPILLFYKKYQKRILLMMSTEVITKLVSLLERCENSYAEIKWWY